MRNVRETLMASRVPVYSMSVDECLESMDMEIAVKDLYEDVVLRPWPADLPEPPTNPV